MQNTKLTFTLTQADEPIPAPDEGGDEVVPSEEETVVAPDTGTFTGTNNANAVSSVALVFSAVLLITIAMVVAVRKLKKTGKLGFVAPVLLIGAVLVGAAGTVVNRGFADTNDDTDYANISAPETIELTSELDKEGNTFSTTKATITMNDATNYGYELYALAGADSLAPKTEGNETTISSIEETGALSANTYGYTLEQDAKPEDEVWYPLSTVASLIYSTDTSTEAEATTDIYFGILTDKDATPDAYELELSFYGTILPISIDSLTYMQEFKTLSAEEKTAVLGSMTQNTQYQLKDSRDQKTYYIAKLADGNVWMTQNLDHDIVTTENFYTPDNTDIPAVWTATPELNSWSSDEPVFFDIADNLCWNGVIGTTGGSFRECTEEDLTNHRQIGNYYNWTAAVAMNDSSQYTTQDIDVNQSICPAGWRLPTKAGDKSYQNLVSNLGLTAGIDGNIQNYPVFFTYGNEAWEPMNEGEPYVDEIGSKGLYWISTTGEYSAPDDEYLGYNLLFVESGTVDPQFVGWSSPLRSSNVLVRCVAR